MQSLDEFDKPYPKMVIFRQLKWTASMAKTEASSNPVANWHHQTTFEIKAGLTPLAIYRQMTARPPGWIAWSFRVRDRLVRPFGVRPIGGFDDAVSLEARVGDRADFFTITNLGADHITLGVEDHHLDVEVHLEIARGSTVDQGTLTTRVWLKNAIGRFYMLPVGLAHPVIVKRLAARVAA